MLCMKAVKRVTTDESDSDVKSQLIGKELDAGKE